MPGDVTVLGQSHRVPASIQPTATDLTARLAKRRPKVWSPRLAEGSLEHAPDFADVDVSGPDVLVLSRNRRFLRETVEPELRRRGVLYEWAGRPSIDPQVVAAITAWEDLRAGKTVQAGELENLFSWINSPPVLQGAVESYVSLRDLGLTESLPPWFDALDRLPPDEVSYIRAARRNGERVLGKPRVRISTIHGAKGGEADHVVLLLDMARRTHDEMERDPDPEVRVWYVGVTRARERLTLVAAQSRRGCPWL